MVSNAAMMLRSSWTSLSVNTAFMMLIFITLCALNKGRVVQAFCPVGMRLTENTQSIVLSISQKAIHAALFGELR